MYVYAPLIRALEKKVAPPAGTNQTSCVASYCLARTLADTSLGFFSCFSCVFAVSARWLLKLNVMYSYTIKAGMSTVFFGGRGGTEEILGSWGGIAVKRLGTPGLDCLAKGVVVCLVHRRFHLEMMVSLMMVE